MGGKCNLKNAVYQENKRKKFILEFHLSDGSCDLITISILSLTNI